jgi:MSHA biogenesis protein MshP
MFPRRRPRSRSTQRGVALVAAIVLVVILAGMVAYVVSISTAQQSGGALDIHGGRALQAARSGMDWGIARVVTAPTAFGTGNCQATPASVNLSSGSGGDFVAHAGFTITVTCAATSYTDGASLFSYALAATACNQPGAGGACPNTASANADYVERRVTTQVVCNASGPC